MQRYRVEPYAVAADVYAHPLQAGRGGWTWYTGSAAWLYRLGLESILGLRRRGETFSIDPCIPSSWRSCSIVWRSGPTEYEFTIENEHHRTRGIDHAVLDGRPVDASAVPILRDGRRHVVRVILR
jgi:cyclic beta-1,2-glucan synthetase